MTRSFPSRFFVGGLAVSPALLAILAVSAFSIALPAREPAAAQDRPPSSGQTPPAPAEQAPRLEPGKPVEERINGGQVHFYRVYLSEGECASVVVEQRGVDVVVKALSTDGKLITEWDSENRLQGEERAELTANAAGFYTLQVEPKYKTLPGGRYQIRLEGLHVATEKDRLLEEARELYTKAYYSIVAGQYDEARAMAQKALELRERTIGPSHPDIAYTLTLLANIDYYKGDLAGAEGLYKRAITMLEETLGAGHPQVATRLNNLASVYQAMGDPAKSEVLHKRALAIREQSLAPDHPDIAQSENNLANVYLDRGDFLNAEPLYLRAIAINEKILGPDHLNLSYPLHNLGFLYLQTEDYDKAEHFLQRALAIREQKLDPGHPAVALVLYNLGEVYRSRGDYVKAEELFQRALAIQEKRLGPDHANVGRCFYSLGNLYFARNQYEQAESFYRRSLAIEETALGRDHPDTLKTANNLARLYMATGNVAQAVALQSRALDGTEHNIDLNLAIGSERQKQAYLATLPDQLDQVISLHVAFAADDPAARDLAATSILRRKGRVLDALSDSFAALHSRMGAQDRAFLDQLNDVTAQLARLVLSGPQRISAAEHEKRTQALEAEREKLEIEISRRSAGFYERSEPVALAAIQSAIADSAALIEFVVYRPFDPKADDRKAYGQPRYVGYVVRNHGPVTWKDLGSAKEIDDVIDALRQALRDPQRNDVPVFARVADEKVMRPLRDLIGNATRLLVSPDGELNMVPFESFVDEQGSYLIERYSITYLTTGRDLLRMQIPRASKSGPVLIADPLFGEPSAALRDGTARTGARPPPAKEKRRSITTGDDLSNVYFAPLAGTAQEVAAIRSLFPDARVLVGPYATKSALEQVVAPLVLHIATHGFFLQDEAQIASSGSGPAGTNHSRPDITRFNIQNPLLRSGLALAGANVKRGGKDGGILTALEASTLNLWGTKLVTLSACETGMGEVKNGEGVYGLRRSFFLAGAESLVMSMWPVSDQVTREMMTAYYIGLKQGLGRGEALRQAELAMLKRKDREHPFYWASFIQAGEWANLSGQR